LQLHLLEVLLKTWHCALCWGLYWRQYVVLVLALVLVLAVELALVLALARCACTAASAWCLY